MNRAGLSDDQITFIIIVIGFTIALFFLIGFAAAGIDGLLQYIGGQT